ncbi:S-methyl-5'-thioadenosine phosphorylase [Zavarzinia sp.]|uniref:S-methyl-5'-thioadenosine phosphorylase n=1 Tax=Zavarzinia sp. TaxID=2027920 RepID=UPI0035689EEF
MAMLGVIGGSGLYDIDGLEERRTVAVKSPWGTPSDEITLGRLGGIEVAFLPRHGRGHVLSPSDIDYRANIDALKRLGVTDILSLSACGSFREGLPPGTFVVVDQFVDRTFARPKSFFGKGMVAHVSMADPACARLGDLVEEAADFAEVTLHRGGTYLAMEGPQFSTRAEANLYRAWGCDVIGMTNMPEAKLAREAEICYATVAMVTDFDCWHEQHGSVDVTDVIAVMQKNAMAAKALIKGAAPLLAERRPAACPHGCDHALEHALITAPGARDPQLVAKLDAVAGRLLKSEG